MLQLLPAPAGAQVRTLARNLALRIGGNRPAPRHFMSWKVSRTFFPSASSTHSCLSCYSPQILRSASWVDLAGRYPKLAASRTGSKIGSSWFSSAHWDTRFVDGQNA